MRERGSSTARPTEKGVGGSHDSVDSVDFGASIRSISVDFGASKSRRVAIWRADCVGRVVSRRVGPIRSRRVASRFGVLLVSRFGVLLVSIRSCPVDSVAIWRADCVGRVVSVVSKSRRVASIRSIRSRRSQGASRRFGRVLSISVVSISVAIWRADCVGRFRRVEVKARRFGRVASRFSAPVESRRSQGASRRVASRFSAPVDSVDSVASRRVEVKAQTQKKPDSSIGESGSAIARRRALLTFR